MFRIFTYQSLFIFMSLILLSLSLPTQQRLKLQPELDAIDVESYLKNERLLKLQIDCVVNDGPCDAVGRFLKPRVAPALLGECPFCTPKQTNDIARVVAFIEEKKPEVYRALFEKFIKDQGITIPSSSTTGASVLPASSDST